MCIYVVGGVKRILVTQQKAGVDMTNKWTGVEHALAAINKACCSNKPNIAMLHANDGMALLIRLLDRAAGAKVREFAALAIVNACSGSTWDSFPVWKDDASVKLNLLCDDDSATENARKYAAGALKMVTSKGK
jgi:hypothetical protein